MEALIRIQKELKAPKGQFNKFGGYHYRSCEDIQEAVKPLLGKAVLLLSDEIVPIGTSRIYVKTTATLTEGEKSVSVTAWARETDSRKGMDAAQVTGSASSYARKYALNGLFLCDDLKDADSIPAENAPSEDSKYTPTTGPAQKPEPQQPAAAPQGQIPAPTPEQREWLKNLWGFYVAGSQGKLQGVDVKPMQEMMRLCQMHMQRYPGSMSDIELCKRYIKVEELIV